MKTLLLASAAAVALTAGGANAAHLAPAVVQMNHVPMHFTPNDGSTVLYDQAQTSGFSSYAVASVLLESASYGIYDSQGADDFVIPGTGKHKISAIYAPGEDLDVAPTSMTVTFYSKVKGQTDTVLKVCSSMPTTGTNDLTVDVKSCGVKLKAGKRYWVSVQAITPSGQAEDDWWYWQTNKNIVGKSGEWDNYGGGFDQCSTAYLQPMKTCFPTSGIGPDLAFEILGK